MSIKGVNSVPFVLLINHDICGNRHSVIGACRGLRPLKLAFIVGFAWTFHEVMVKNSRVNRQKREMAAMGGLASATDLTG